MQFKRLLASVLSLLAALMVAMSPSSAYAFEEGCANKVACAASCDGDENDWTDICEGNYPRCGTVEDASCAEVNSCSVGNELNSLDDETAGSIVCEFEGGSTEQ